MKKSGLALCGECIHCGTIVRETERESYFHIEAKLALMIRGYTYQHEVTIAEGILCRHKYSELTHTHKWIHRHTTGDDNKTTDLVIVM